MHMGVHVCLHVARYMSSCSSLWLDIEIVPRLNYELNDTYYARQTDQYLKDSIHCLNRINTKH